MITSNINTNTLLKQETCTKNQFEETSSAPFRIYTKERPEQSETRDTMKYKRIARGNSKNPGKTNY